MKYISTIITEARGSEEFFRQCKKYIDKLEGKLPAEVVAATKTLERYGVDDKNEINELLGTKSRVGAFAKRHGMSLTDAETLSQQVKRLNNDGLLRLLPIMQSELERTDLMNSKREMDDITMDLETEQGRSNVVKKYAGLAQSIAKKYINKSNLSLEELYSAALEGLAEAINQYRKPTDEDEKHLTFRQYAGWKIKQRILMDINDLSRVVRRPRTEYEKSRETGGIARDVRVNLAGRGDDNEDSSWLEKRLGLTSDDEYDIADADKKWAMLYRFIDKQFPKRDADIFYRVFGVNGREHEKSIQIAKDLGVSNGTITHTIQKIINALKEKPQTKDLLQDLARLYTESLMVDNVFKCKDAVMEVFATDAIYGVLERMTRFCDGDVLRDTLNEVLANYSDEAIDTLVGLFESGMVGIDDKYDENKDLIIDFLENMRPDIRYSTYNDIDIIGAMVDIAENIKSNNIKLKENE